LSAPATATRTPRYGLVTATGEQDGAIAGGATVRVAFRVAVPAHRFADAQLSVRGETRLEDGRLVGLHLDRVEVTQRQST
jgi:hypothetical protein